VSGRVGGTAGFLRATGPETLSDALLARYGGAPLDGAAGGVQAMFAVPADALRAACAAQRAGGDGWAAARIVAHAARMAGPDDISMAQGLCDRLLRGCRDGQILVTGQAAARVVDELPPGSRLVEGGRPGRPRSERVRPAQPARAAHQFRRP
jgi:hypothetical protein